MRADVSPTIEVRACLAKTLTLRASEQGSSDFARLWGFITIGDDTESAVTCHGAEQGDAAANRRTPRSSY